MNVASRNQKHRKEGQLCWRTTAAVSSSPIGIEKRQHQHHDAFSCVTRRGEEPGLTIRFDGSGQEFDWVRLCDAEIDSVCVVSTRPPLCLSHVVVLRSAV